jgi:putative acetyltransferase
MHFYFSTTSSGAPMQIKQASFPEDSETLKSLIREYIAWLDMDLSYRGFEQEMAQFEQLFTLPSGFFLMAHSDGGVVGCVGLLRHIESTAEVKRLYVKPSFRGQQLGEQLIRALIQKAQSHGFMRLILDAVPQTTAAQKLYQSMGFQQIEPYYDNPVPGTKFYELALDFPQAG